MDHIVRNLDVSDDILFKFYWLLYLSFIFVNHFVRQLHVTVTIFPVSLLCKKLARLEWLQSNCDNQCNVINLRLLNSPFSRIYNRSFCVATYLGAGCLLSKRLIFHHFLRFAARVPSSTHLPEPRWVTNWILV